MTQSKENFVQILEKASHQELLSFVNSFITDEDIETILVETSRLGLRITFSERIIREDKKNPQWPTNFFRPSAEKIIQNLIYYSDFRSIFLFLRKEMCHGPCKIWIERVHMIFSAATFYVLMQIKKGVPTKIEDFYKIFFPFKCLETLLSFGYTFPPHMSLYDKNQSPALPPVYHIENPQELYALAKEFMKENFPSGEFVPHTECQPCSNSEQRLRSFIEENFSNNGMHE